MKKKKKGTRKSLELEYQELCCEIVNYEKDCINKTRNIAISMDALQQRDKNSNLKQGAIGNYCFLGGGEFSSPKISFMTGFLGSMVSFGTIYIIMKNGFIMIHLFIFHPYKCNKYNQMKNKLSVYKPGKV